jgi:hypothetical protein
MSRKYPNNQTILEQFKQTFPEHKDDEILVEEDDDGPVVVVYSEDVYTFDVIVRDKSISFQWLS